MKISLRYFINMFNIYVVNDVDTLLKFFEIFLGDRGPLYVQRKACQRQC